MVSLLFVLASVLTASVVAVLVGAVVVGFAFLFAQLVGALGEARGRRLDALGRKLGLDRRGAKFYGAVEGIGVRVEGRRTNDVNYVDLSWGLPAGWKGLLAVRDQGFFDWGQDVELGHAAIDRTLWIKGCERAAKAVLLDPEVIELYRGLRRSGTLKFRQTGLTLRQRGHIRSKQRVLLEHGARLVKAMERARVRPWQQAAERFGLALSDGAQRLEGKVNGHDVLVRQAEAQHLGVLDTVIRVPLRRNLPLGTRITRGGNGVRLGDPILDSAICVKGDAELLAPLLCEDETRALLMSVVHGFPGSEVNETDIILRASGRLMHELEGAIRDVVGLAAALQPLRHKPLESASQARRRREEQST